MRTKECNLQRWAKCGSACETEGSNGDGDVLSGSVDELLQFVGSFRGQNPVRIANCRPTHHGVPATQKRALTACVIAAHFAAVLTLDRPATLLRACRCRRVGNALRRPARFSKAVGVLVRVQWCCKTDTQVCARSRHSHARGRQRAEAGAQTFAKLLPAAAVLARIAAPGRASQTRSCQLGAAQQNRDQCRSC